MMSRQSDKLRYRWVARDAATSSHVIVDGLRRKSRVVVVQEIHLSPQFFSFLLQLLFLLLRAATLEILAPIFQLVAQSLE